MSIAPNVSFVVSARSRKINRARPKVKEETKELRGAPPFGAASPFVGLCALFLSEHGLDLYGSFALPEIKASSDKSGQHRVVRLMRARFRSPGASLCGRQGSGASCLALKTLDPVAGSNVGPRSGEKKAHPEALLPLTELLSPPAVDSVVLEQSRSTIILRRVDLHVTDAYVATGQVQGTKNRTADAPRRLKHQIKSRLIHDRRKTANPIKS